MIQTKPSKTINSKSFINTENGVWAQFGCGLCSPKGWTNFDASPTLRLQKIPILGSLIPSGPFGRFPMSVKYGDILKGLPLEANSVDLLYCSHILEHLTVQEVDVALSNCFRCLKPNGIFRLVLPDIEAMATEYIQSSSPDAVHHFMQLTWLGEEHRTPSALSAVKQWMSRGRHLWMWDYKAFEKKLENAGFCNIRRAKFGDSDIDAFQSVEDPDRWIYELGIHCYKSNSTEKA